MKTNFVAACLGLISLGVYANGPAPDGVPLADGPLTTIEALDVPRYMGTWYEIAKLPNWFQRQCVGHTKATYTLKVDGGVEVVNQCRIEGGGTTQTTGLARQLGGTASPKLEVSFAPAWLSFIPAVWGNYWVVDLDEGYQLAAVSEPKREYLWILSRTPSVDKQAYDRLVERLARKGLDVDKLELTPQE